MSTNCVQILIQIFAVLGTLCLTSKWRFKCVSYRIARNFEASYNCFVKDEKVCVTEKGTTFTKCWKICYREFFIKKFRNLKEEKRQSLVDRIVTTEIKEIVSQCVEIYY